MEVMESRQASLKECLLELRSSPQFAQLLNFALQSTPLEKEMQELINELHEGLTLLKARDERAAQKYLNNRQETIIGDTTSCLQRYLRTQKRKLEDYIADLSGIRSFLSQHAAMFAMKNNVDEIAFDKINSALVTALNWIVQQVGELSLAIDDPAIFAGTESQNVEKSLHRIKVVANTVLSLEFALQGNDKDAVVILDHLQVSPIAIEDLRDLFIRLYEGRNRPTIEEVERAVNRLMLDKLKEETDIEDIIEKVHESTDRISSGIELRTERISEVPDSIPAAVQQAVGMITDEEYEPIRRMNSLNSMMQKAQSSQLELEFRKYAFMKDRNAPLFFSSDNESFQTWQELKMITHGGLLDAESRLKRLAARILPTSSAAATEAATRKAAAAREAAKSRR